MILTAFVYSTQFKCNISLHSNSVIMPAPCIVSGCDWFVDFWRIAHELISGCDWFLPYFGCKLNSNGLLPDRPAEQILMLAALMSSQGSQAKAEGWRLRLKLSFSPDDCFSSVSHSIRILQKKVLPQCVLHCVNLTFGTCWDSKRKKAKIKVKRRLRCAADGNLMKDIRGGSHNSKDSTLN